jgi:hypothetical protein
MRRLPVLVFLSALPVGALQAQTTMVYRLGRDTVAIEQHTRTGDRMTGEVVSRSPVVRRLQYEVTLGSNGRATRAVLRQRQANGQPVANQPTETRLTFSGDSIRREVVWADSTQSRTVYAPRALFVLAWPSVATLELLAQAQRAAPADSFPGFGTGAQPTWYRLERVQGDTLQLSGGFYPFRVTFDAAGSLRSLDGSLTANKVTGTPAASPMNLAEVAARMTPMGQASARGTATGPFNFPIFVDYGRPQVRDRTVWGGVLVPTDSVWRAGANAATHLATTRTLAFGDVVVAPGIYTLYIHQTREGPVLLINRQIGQWGTVYDASQTIGRVPMQMAPTPDFVEEFTIAIRQAGPNRGALDFAWGPAVATAAFAIR